MLLLLIALGLSLLLSIWNGWCCRELSLRRGDVVFLLRAVDENWFEGEHHGLVGRFPVTYVEARLNCAVVI